MRPQARGALALSLALLTVAGCENHSSSDAAAAPTDTGAQPVATLAATARPEPTLDDFVRSWTVDRTVGDAFTCHEDEPKPCHLGHATNEEDDDSEWSIRIKERTARNPADCSNSEELRQFDFTAYKSTPGAGSGAPTTTTVGFGILCEVDSTQEIDIAGTPRFRHGAGFEPHSIHMTLVKKNSGSKPFRMRIDMQNKVHIHNGSGHGED
jgi:hypothetical protein